jgi:hypothetical protein
VQANPRGEFLGVAPTRSLAPSATNAAGLLSYHGGPVMYSSKAYAIFWAPAGTYMPPSYKSAVDQYFKDVSADSYKNSNVYSVGQQYNDSTGKFAAYDATYGGQFTDTKAFPANGCTDSATTKCLSDAQLRAELGSFITAHSLPRGMATMYFLFTPPNIGSCFDATHCAFTEYCAYHSSFGSGATTTLYANQPFAGFQNGCDTGNYPNGDAADATLSW